MTSTLPEFTKQLSTQENISKLEERLRVVIRKLRRDPMNESYSDEWVSLQRKLSNIQKEGKPK